mmetsp:Transcript_734/g.1946  ORF Transcript_734/g.1946 Transcript_734/m.1946 type:complete len:347 (+) Transcript_734:636-1676(+)
MFLIWDTRALTASSVDPSPTTTQFSFASSSFFAVPSTSTPTSARFRPTSSLTTVPPVRMARSSRYWLLRSPKPGALSAQILSVPRSLLTTSVARASCSMSSAMMQMGNPWRMAASSTLTMSRALEIFLSTSSSLQSSYTHFMFSGSVTKYGEMNPRSNCMPSTTNSWFSVDRPSSSVMTPVRPTRAMADWIISPTSALFPADTAATLASSESSTSLDISLSAATSSLTTWSIPRVSCTGLVPAATTFIPSAIIAEESTVAVVVPSPAWSFVFDAACLTRRAPIFSSGSSSSTSFATVTPSLTIFGEPYLDSSTTFLPLGPSVTPTTVASLSAPACILRRAAQSRLK